MGWDDDRLAEFLDFDDGKRLGGGPAVGEVGDLTVQGILPVQPDQHLGGLGDTNIQDAELNPPTLESLRRLDWIVQRHGRAGWTHKACQPCPARSPRAASGS